MMDKNSLTLEISGVTALKTSIRLFFVAIEAIIMNKTISVVMYDEGN